MRLRDPVVELQCLERGLASLGIALLGRQNAMAYCYNVRDRQARVRVRVVRIKAGRLLEIVDAFADARFGPFVLEVKASEIRFVRIWIDRMGNGSPRSFRAAHRGVNLSSDVRRYHAL